MVLDAVLRMATEFRPGIATCFVDSLHTAIVITWLERKFFDQLNSISLSLSLLYYHTILLGYLCFPFPHLSMVYRMQFTCL